MAVNIYHEAGNQSMIGQMAVGQVVLNRVAINRFPDTVCEVVKEGHNIQELKQACSLEVSVHLVL